MNDQNQRIGINLGEAILDAQKENHEDNDSHQGDDSPQQEENIGGVDGQNNEKQNNETQEESNKTGSGFLDEIIQEDKPDEELSAGEENEAEDGQESDGEESEQQEGPEESLESSDEDRESRDVTETDPTSFKKRIRKIKEREQQERERIKQEYEQKIKEIQENKSRPGDEPTEQEKQELIMLRRKFQLENDPEIKEKYDEPLQANHQRVNDILSRHGMSEDNIKYIDKVGGFDVFAQREPEKAKQILQAVSEENPVESSILQTKISENISLRDARQRFVENATQKAEEFFQNQTQQFQKNQEELQRQQQARVESLENNTRMLMEKSQMLRDVEITEDMGEQERKEAEKINQRRSLIRDKAIQATRVQTSEEAAEIVATAAHAFELKEQLKEANNKLARAQKELARLRKPMKGKSHGNLSSSQQGVDQSASSQQGSKPKNFMEGFKQDYEAHIQNQ